MGKKRRSEQHKRQEESTRTQKKLLIAVGAVCAVAIVAVLVASVVKSVGNPDGTRNLSVSVDEAGDLRIARSKVKSGVNYVDYGGPEQLIVWIDDNGAARTAYDTCVQCHPEGAVHYQFSNRNLVCNRCGTPFSLESLGSPSWGSCEPVSIPAAYRLDTGKEIVVPGDVLEYADLMFAQWSKGDYTISMQNFVDSI